jgi:hypothetical protein
MFINRPKKVAFTDAVMTYESVHGYELAEILTSFPYEKEIRFYIDDLRALGIWEVPADVYYIKKTRVYGEAMIIVGLLNGGDIKMVRISDLKPVFRQENASDLVRFINPYLLNHGGAQRVTVIKRRKNKR